MRFVTSRSCIFHILVLQIIGKPSLRARCPQSGGQREVIATTTARLAHFVFVANPALLGRGHGICLFVGYAPFDVVYLNPF